jgi:hypothetical protein
LQVAADVLKRLLINSKIENRVVGHRVSPIASPAALYNTAPIDHL